MLRSPAPPFAEIGLWFDDQDDGHALMSVVDALTDFGGVVEGQIGVHSAHDARQPFQSPSDFLVDLRSVRGPDELVATAEETDCRVVSVEVRNLDAERPNEVAIVTLGRSPRPVLHSHPVQVWVSGDVIDESIRTDKPCREGLWLASIFRFVVLHTAPSYGAISFERPLATPAAFKDPATQGDHPDFYLGRRFAGPAGIAEVASAAGPAAEILETGVLVLSTRAFGAARGSNAQVAASALRRQVLRATLGGDRTGP